MRRMAMANCCSRHPSLSDSSETACKSQGEGLSQIHSSTCPIQTRNVALLVNDAAKLKVLPPASSRICNMQDTYERMQRTGRYEPPPELQRLEMSGVFDLGHAYGPESRPLTRAGSRPATRPGTPGGASRGGTMHLASLQAIIGQPSNMQHLPERPGSALSNSSMQRPKTSRGKPASAHTRPQTTGTLSSSVAGRFPSSQASMHRPRV